MMVKANEDGTALSCLVQMNPGVEGELFFAKNVYTESNILTAVEYLPHI